MALPTTKSGIMADIARQFDLPITDVKLASHAMQFGGLPKRVNVDEIGKELHKRSELRAPMIAGAMHRPIEGPDMAGATRGLQLAHKQSQDLHTLISQHAGRDMFASAVIVAAATRLLHNRGVLDVNRFSMVELVAMRRTPIDEITCIIEREITKRAEVIREAEAMCKVGVHSWCSEQGKLPADTKCDFCDEVYGEPS
jgi:hypothetical protein